MHMRLGGWELGVQFLQSADGFERRIPPGKLLLEHGVLELVVGAVDSMLHVAIARRPSQ